MSARGLGLALFLFLCRFGIVSGSCCSDCVNACKQLGGVSSQCSSQVCYNKCYTIVSGVPGQYVDCPSMTAMTCPTGTYSTTWSASNTLSSCLACTGCPSGKFQTSPCSSTADNAQCQACSVCRIGQITYSPCMATADAVCQNCNAGQYGYFFSAVNTYGCVSCDAGTYQPESGKSSCIACSPPCVLGQYMVSDCTVAQNRVCLACTAFRTGSTPTSSSCDACLAGYYLNPNGACTACGAVQSDPSSYCSVGSYITCPAGEKGVTCKYCTGYPPPGSGYCGAGLEPNMACDGMKMVDTQCVACKAGYFKADASTFACAACSTGYYSGAGAVACIACTNRPQAGSQYVAWTSPANSSSCPWCVSGFLVILLDDEG